MARTIVLLALSSAALAVAKTTTVDLFVNIFPPDDIVASVINVDATATTYEIRYTTDNYRNQWEKEFGSTPQTIIQGPETVSMVYSYSADYGNYYYGS